MKHTENCVRCFEKAKMWTGHVRKGDEDVIAGWCSKKCHEAPGFYGQWTSEMGKEMRWED